jgi:hypothetical protein
MLRVSFTLKISFEIFFAPKISTVVRERCSQKHVKLFALPPSSTRTAITRQLLVEIFRIEFYKYPFKDLGADTRSQIEGQT